MKIGVAAKAGLSDVLRRMSKIPKENEGRIAWDAHALDKGTFEVLFNLTFSSPVADYDKDAAIWYSLNECARKKDFSSKFFLVQVRVYFDRLLGKETRTFTAIAQINAETSSGLPQKFRSFYGPVNVRSNLSPVHKKIIDGLERYDANRINLQEDFVYIVCAIRSRSERSALDSAYRNIKYALGVMNLALDGHGPSKRFGYPNAPLGKFLTATPIFLIDYRSRKLGDWRSENHYPMLWKQNFRVWQKQDSDVLIKFARNIASDLSKTDFEEIIVKSIILFQEGLETRSIEMALLKFWTGIEVLCSKQQQESSEKIVERASSIFDDYEHASMRLRHLQEYRNQIVHRGDSGDHALLCAQFGAVYLGALIKFFLWNIYKFRARDTILEFLSLPLNDEKLAMRSALAQKRRKALTRMDTRRATNQK